MLPTLPVELVAAICREAIHTFARNSRAAAGRVAVSSSIAYKEAAPILHRVLHISSTNFTQFQALLEDTVTVSKLGGTAAERVRRQTKHLIVTTENWRPARGQIALFSSLQTASGSPLFLRRILHPDWHVVLPTTLKKVHVWDAIYITDLPPSITHVSVRFPRPGHIPYISGLVDFSAPAEYTMAGRNPGLQHLGFEIIDRFAPGSLVVNEVTMRQLLTRIFGTSTSPGMRVTFRATGRAAFLDSWDRYVRAVDSLSAGEKARVQAWRDERASDQWMSHFEAKYDTGIDLHLALDDAWEERDMWTTATPLTGEDSNVLKSQDVLFLNMTGEGYSYRRHGKALEEGRRDCL